MVVQKREKEGGEESLKRDEFVLVKTKEINNKWIVDLLSMCVVQCYDIHHMSSWELWWVVQCLISDKKIKWWKLIFLV